MLRKLRQREIMVFLFKRSFISRWKQYCREATPLLESKEWSLGKLTFWLINVTNSCVLVKNEFLQTSTCSKSTIETAEQTSNYAILVLLLILNIPAILFLVFVLLTLNRWLFAGILYLPLYVIILWPTAIVYRFICYILTLLLIDLFLNLQKLFICNKCFKTRHAFLYVFFVLNSAYFDGIWRNKLGAHEIPKRKTFGSTMARWYNPRDPRQHHPLYETHLVAVRRLIHQEVSTRVRQRGELNWASQLKPSGQQISSTIISRPESILIRQD